MYESIKAKLEAGSRGEYLSQEIKQWENEGDELIGEVVEVQRFRGGQYDTECNQYILNTDNGLVSTILGTAVDKSLAEVNVIGRILYILYRGKKHLKDGRQVNLFTVQDVTDLFEGE